MEISIIEFLAEEILGVIAIILGGLIVFAARKAVKSFEQWTGIQIAEMQAFNIVQSLRRIKSNNEEIYFEALKVVSDRLKQRGIKISDDEIADIVTSVLDTLEQEFDKE